MKKRTLTFISSKDKKVLLIAAIVLVIVLTLFGVHRLLAYQDGRRFAEISNDKDVVVNALVSYLGNNVESVEPKDICFNTEQGPYDNGRLWCQVATVVSLKSDVEQVDIGDRFVQAAHDKGFTAQSNTTLGVHRYWFDVGDASCIFSAIATNGDAIGGAASDPFVDSGAPAIAVSCADHAKAKHYPYVN